MLHGKKFRISRLLLDNGSRALTRNVRASDLQVFICPKLIVKK